MSTVPAPASPARPRGPVRRRRTLPGAPTGLERVVDLCDTVRCAPSTAAVVAEVVRGLETLLGARCEVLLGCDDGFVRHTATAPPVRVDVPDPASQQVLVTSRPLRVDDLGPVASAPPPWDVPLRRPEGDPAARSLLALPLVGLTGAVVCTSARRAHFGPWAEHVARLVVGSVAAAPCGRAPARATGAVPVPAGPPSHGDAPRGPRTPPAGGGTLLPPAARTRLPPRPSGALVRTAAHGPVGATQGSGGALPAVRPLLTDDLGRHPAPDLAGLGAWTVRRGQAGAEVSWSARMFEIAGRPAGDVPGLDTWADLVVPEDRRLFDRALHPGPWGARPGAAGPTPDGTGHLVRWRTPDGLRHVRLWSGTVVEPDGTLVVHGAAQDVTEHARDREALTARSLTDPVTGLGNRAAFDTWMADLLDRTAGPVALLLVDLDRFKLVNDTLGHQAGDRLLGEVGARLRGAVPDGAKVCRLGGDEFAVLLPGGDPRRAGETGDAVLSALRAPVRLDRGRRALVCRGSVGVAVGDPRRTRPEDLLAEADQALYRAKDLGRDRLVVHDERLRARVRDRDKAEDLLRRAIAQDRLHLRFQPVVHLATGRTVGAEALVRLAVGERGRLVPPGDFMAVAEESGLVADLDRKVVEQALTGMGEWIRRTGTTDAWISLNLSDRSLDEPRVGEHLLSVMRHSGVLPSQVKIELTEETFLKSFPTRCDTLRKWSDAGVGIGVDDFGTGYSALASLDRHPLQFMKIDEVFTTSVGASTRADAVVAALIDLAHAHGLEVVAEGVESALQARRLRELGCDLGQGHHFGHPGDLDRIVMG